MMSNEIKVSFRLPFILGFIFALLDFALYILIKITGWRQDKLSGEMYKEPINDNLIELWGHLHLPVKVFIEPFDFYLYLLICFIYMALFGFLLGWVIKRVFK